MSIPWQVIGTIVALTAAYAVVILGLIQLLRWAQAPSRWVILLSFLVYGLVAGVLAAWAWPYDSTVYPNLWATLLGDVLTSLPDRALGGLWLLQVPQVYAVTSLALCAALGLATQGLWNHAHPPAGKDNGGPGSDSAWPESH
jgi:hypothetical protein